MTSPAGLPGVPRTSPRDPGRLGPGHSLPGSWPRRPGARLSRRFTGLTIGKFLGVALLGRAVRLLIAALESLL